MKADLVMGIHFHQPVGNLDHVIEGACDRCYLPFLRTLQKYPAIKMSFHFSGSLLEWAEKRRPGMIDIVREMAGNGQVELMSGGFYEPIFPSIPYPDALAQIMMLNEYIRSNFSRDPKGAWVAERVWEPDMPSIFHDSGIRYVILDDTHFLYAGLTKDQTYGHYLTEDNGKAIAVFPSDKTLRYHIPFKMPEECTRYMKGVLERNSGATFIYGDDGEKFGEWPGTHKWVFEEKWLEKFFDELMKNAGWLGTVTFSEYLAKKPPLGKIYLPAASYEEMLEWSLPVETQRLFEDIRQEIKDSGNEDRYRPFIRGGFWRNFFVKYPESDRMRRKMLRVSGKLGDLQRRRGTKRTLLAKAEKELFRGQCNCAYWHGVFGGLYLFHLRKAIYHHLISSEVLMDRALYGRRSYCRSFVPPDAGGIDEVVLENRELSLCFDPGKGGVLKELDSKTLRQNLTNTLARRKEAYHRKIVDARENNEDRQGSCQTIHEGIQAPEADVKNYLVYDRHGRHCLIDHFIEKNVGMKAFSSCDYTESGDFAGGRYDFDVRKGRKGIVLSMTRRGNVAGAPLSMEKQVDLRRKGASFTVRYTIENKGVKALDVVFAPEFNFIMPDADSERYSLAVLQGKKRYGLGSETEEDGVLKISILDVNKRPPLEIECSEKFRLWHFPVKTVSQSEKAYELNYQGSALILSFDIALKAGDRKVIELRVKTV